jgi:hypothetical protein
VTRNRRFLLLPLLILLLLGSEAVGCPIRVFVVRNGPPLPPPPLYEERPPADAGQVPAVQPSPNSPPLLAGVLNLKDFFNTFEPRPGKHQVTLLHPVTGQPTVVTFILPRGKLYEMVLRKRGLDFDYGDNLVSIVFLRNGGVQVSY